MKRLLALPGMGAIFGAALACASAQAQQVSVKIGILNDMSSVYADAGGPGSVLAAKMAIADFTAAHPDVKVELLSADHQNKPDVGTSIASKWIDVDKVDMILDVPNSGVALAIANVVKQKNKVFVINGAATSDLTGPKCNANIVHWTYDTWMLANGTGKAMVKTGGDTWFFLTADYAFGLALERDTVRRRESERRQGAGRRSPSAQQQRLLLVPGAGAGLEGQGDRARQCGRRHHQLDQAGGRVRHRQGRAEPRRPAGVHQRRRGARPADRAGAGADRDVLLGPQRQHARLDQALAAGAAGQMAQHGARRQLREHAALSQGGRGAQERGRRRRGGRQDEGAADRRSAVRQGHDPRRRPQAAPGLSVRGEEAGGSRNIPATSTSCAPPFRRTKLSVRSRTATARW